MSRRPGRPSTEVSMLWWGRSVLGWGTVAVVLAVTLARLVAPDGSALIASSDAAVVVVYLPAWGVAAAAALARRWLLAAAAGLLVAVHLVLVAPMVTSAPPRAAPGTALRLLDANVSTTNPSMAGYAAQIRQWWPDVVALHEANADVAAALGRLGAWAATPYVEQGGDGLGFNFVVASRYPLAPARIVFTSDGLRPLALQTTVATPSGPLALWLVHTMPPNQAYREWAQDLRDLADWLRRSPGRLVVGADLNATWGNPLFGAVLGAGITDAAAGRGVILSPTWPQARWLPPLLQLDHVLTRGVGVTALTTAPGPGSDHRELRAVLGLGPAVGG